MCSQHRAVPSEAHENNNCLSEKLRAATRAITIRTTNRSLPHMSLQSRSGNLAGPPALPTGCNVYCIPGCGTEDETSMVLASVDCYLQKFLTTTTPENIFENVLTGGSTATRDRRKLRGTYRLEVILERRRSHSMSFFILMIQLHFAAPTLHLQVVVHTLTCPQ